MGLRNVTTRNLTEELERVHRHIDLAVNQLSQARVHMSVDAAADGETSVGSPAEDELGSLCISLELALADSVVWAQRLTERLGRLGKRPQMSSC